MKPHEDISALHASAAVLLPGLRQARALLDATISVYEYFDRHAMRDLHTRTFTGFTPAPKNLQTEVEKLKDFLAAFSHLHELPPKTEKKS